MKASSLHDLWASPDNSRLTAKQFSFRLPVHIAAKLAALCEMFPQKNRTQIVADLLTSALDELESHLPMALGNPDLDDYHEQEMARMSGEPYEQIHFLGGPRGHFRSLANAHYRELEKEMGNESPELLYPVMWITESTLKK